MVSMARIELALHAPKARVMPFHYTEIALFRTVRNLPDIVNCRWKQVQNNNYTAFGLNNQVNILQGPR